MAVAQRHIGLPQWGSKEPLCHVSCLTSNLKCVEKNVKTLNTSNIKYYKPLLFNILKHILSI